MSKNEWDYSVDVRDVQVATVDGQLVRKVRATVDSQTGELLGLVSRRYTPIQNSTLYKAMDQLTPKLDLRLTDAYTVANKSGTIFRYEFNTEKQISASKEANDKVRFGLELFNSFDSQLGTRCFRAYANRLVCSNGLTTPKEFGQISLKNLDFTNVSNLESVLREKIDPILGTVETWNTWAEISPSRTKVGEFISGNFSEKLSETMLAQYESSKDKSLWGLYNLITYHISHNLKVRANGRHLRLRQWEMEKIATKFYTVDFV